MLIKIAQKVGLFEVVLLPYHSKISEEACFLERYLQERLWQGKYIKRRSGLNSFQRYK